MSQLKIVVFTVLHEPYGIISDLCLCFSSPMYAGLPNLDFIVMTTFCSWNDFYRDYFETDEHSPVLFHSDLVNQKPCTPLSHTCF